LSVLLLLAIVLSVLLLAIVLSVLFSFGHCIVCPFFFEIGEKRLKLNAERTIKQNKAAETGKNIAYNYTVTCIMFLQPLLSIDLLLLIINVFNTQHDLILVLGSQSY
jgi:hypothetical protein